MNIWWLLPSTCWINLIMQKGEETEIGTGENLIQIQIQTHMQKDQGQDRRHLTESKHITYNPYELKKIKYDTDKDVRYKQLSFESVNSIRDLKLLRRKRGCRGGQDEIAYHHIEKPKSITWQNLMKIPCIANRRVRHDGKLCLMVINTQSIKKKTF